MNKELLERIFKDYNIQLSKEMLNKFELFYNFLIEKNKIINLTAITNEDDVIKKHFLDSCLANSFIEKGARMIDVGSGAGFPAIPLKILRDDLDIVMIDSLNKRVEFLCEIIKLLKLNNCEAVHDRCEDFAKKHFEEFDIAISRAVAKVPTLAEYLIPLVKVGGKIIMLKSQKTEEELKLGEYAIEHLGGQVDKVFKINIDDMERDIIIITKIKPTSSKYPRGKNLPKTKPLVKV